MWSSRSVMLARLAATCLFFVTATVRAEVIVNSDSGTIGTFDLTNNGGGSLTLLFDGTELLTNINGATVGPFTADFAATIPLTFSSIGSHDYLITSGTLTKTFTDANGGTASLHYDLTTAETGTLLPDDANLGGKILGLVSNGFSGFDFSGLNGTQNFALTATAYGGGASTMDTVFTTTGGTAHGSVAFSESALKTPVPSTLVMAITSLIGVVVLRPFRRSKAIAA